MWKNYASVGAWVKKQLNSELCDTFAWLVSMANSIKAWFLHEDNEHCYAAIDHLKLFENIPLSHKVTNSLWTTIITQKRTKTSTLLHKCYQWGLGLPSIFAYFEKRFIVAYIQQYSLTRAVCMGLTWMSPIQNLHYVKPQNFFLLLIHKNSC